jgi:hypothetical protein
MHRIPNGVRDPVHEFPKLFDQLSRRARDEVRSRLVTGQRYIQRLGSIRFTKTESGNSEC